MPLVKDILLGVKRAGKQPVAPFLKRLDAPKNSAFHKRRFKLDERFHGFPPERLWFGPKAQETQPLSSFSFTTRSGSPAGPNSIPKMRQSRSTNSKANIATFFMKSLEFFVRPRQKSGGSVLWRKSRRAKAGSQRAK